jgi:hypothetical protein
MLATLLLWSCPLLAAPAGESLIGGLDALEREAGWRELFDAGSTTGWRGAGSDAFPKGWEVSGGALRCLEGIDFAPPDLVSREEFGDFELELECRTARWAIGNVRYRAELFARGVWVAPGLRIGKGRGELPGVGELEPAEGSLPSPLLAGEEQHVPRGERWRRVRIVARGEHVEHWIDGHRLVDTSVGSEAWNHAVGGESYLEVARIARGRGPFVLGAHAYGLEYRNIVVRDLEHLPGRPVALFDGESLAGWRALGDAKWSVEDGAIVGESGGGSQSFLVTERRFGDFLLEVEVMLERGNSGIQIRSHENDAHRAFGLQVEIDPTPRAWSGGIYDEARRGWLADLSKNELARATFKIGEWNRYRIECTGPRIRTWVNGVPAADLLDAVDIEGFVGLQVHGGQDVRVRWRNFEMHDLGTRVWEHFGPREWSSERDGHPGIGVTLRVERDLGDLTLRMPWEQSEKVRLFFDHSVPERAEYVGTGELRDPRWQLDHEPSTDPLFVFRIAGEWTFRRGNRNFDFDHPGSLSISPGAPVRLEVSTNREEVPERSRIEEAFELLSEPRP